MTIEDRTASGQTETISLEIELEHPPEKVWRARTEPELLSQWLLSVSGLELEPGAAFTFTREPMPDRDGTVHCRVLEVEPRRRLSYTWVVGDMEIDTVVAFTLTPTSSGTRLLIVQSGFEPDQKRNFAGARYGWKMMGEKLVELLGRNALTGAKSSARRTAGCPSSSRRRWS